MKRDPAIKEIILEPLFLSCAETDFTFPHEFRNRAVDIMDKENKEYQLQLFSGVEHGFALRCDLSKPYERTYIPLSSRV